MLNPQSSGKHIARTLSRTVDNAVLLTLLVCLLLAAYSLWDTHQLNEDADAKQYEMYKPEANDTKSFDELRAMNPDVIGWLTIYDTKIDYPMVCSPRSNSDYLSKNAEGQWATSGSLFLDHENQANFTDFNTIIYGHHMSGHTMFGDLDLFLEQSFFETHEYGDLFYEGQNHGLQIFAMMSVDAYDKTLYAPAIIDESVRQDYLTYIKEKALYWRELGITTQDHIVLMSTCSADITNGRYVLVGKILDHPVANPFPEEERATSNERVDIYSILSNFMNRPVWQWILILIALIILTWCLYSLEKRRVRISKEKKQQKRLKAENENEKT